MGGGGAVNCDMISGAYANGAWRTFKTVPVCEWSCLVEEEDVKGELENENRPKGIVVTEIVVDAVTIASRCG